MELAYLVLLKKAFSNSLQELLASLDNLSLNVFLKVSLLNDLQPSYIKRSIAKIYSSYKTSRNRLQAQTGVLK